MRLLLDVGEWWHSNVLFGAVFAFAGILIFALAWYVMRGDRLNRLGMDEDPLASEHPPEHH